MARKQRGARSEPHLMEREIFRPAKGALKRLLVRAHKKLVKHFVSPRKLRRRGFTGLQDEPNDVVAWLRAGGIDGDRKCAEIPGKDRRMRVDRERRAGVGRVLAEH